MEHIIGVLCVRLFIFVAKWQQPAMAMAMPTTLTQRYGEGRFEAIHELCVYFCTTQIVGSVLQCKMSQAPRDSFQFIFKCTQSVCGIGWMSDKKEHTN